LDTSDITRREDAMDILESAKSGRRKMGRTFLIRHLEGKRLTQQQAIRAKCYDCDGMGETGECDLKECPLYSYSPFALGTHVEAVGEKITEEV
jgi:hypothetical protein